MIWLMIISMLQVTLAINPMPGEVWETGRFPLGNQGDSMFYYLMKARQNAETAPLIIWVDGGPGCTSATGAFLHNGPYFFNKSSVFQYNEYSWNNLANMLYVDNPVGAGYSHAKDKSTYCRNETCVAKNLYAFLLHFLEDYPEYYNRPLYISGESYAGHYVPAFAEHIAKAKHPYINLKGCGIGNGLVDLYAQLPHYPEYLLANHNISVPIYWLFKVMTMMCSLGVEYEAPLFNYACNGARGFMARFAGIKVTTDITWKGGEGVDINKFIHYMNSTEVRKAFGTEHESFLFYSNTVYGYLKDDIKLSLRQKLGYLLDQGYKVLQWFGDKDYLDNWMSGLYVAHNLPWSGAEVFRKAEFQEWKGTTEDKVYGEVKSNKHYTFIKVYNAGHSIFDRQRAAGYEVLKQLIHA